MLNTKLSRLEFQIMETLWTRVELSIREILDSFSAKRKPAYTTVQTTVYRMESKKIVQRVRKVGNFHIFAPLVSREAAQRKLIDDLLGLFGGRTQPIMAHLVDSGKLSIQDVRDAEKALQRMAKARK